MQEKGASNRVLDAGLCVSLTFSRRGMVSDTCFRFFPLSGRYLLGDCGLEIPLW